MDCPHRERLGYGEVAFACSWGIALPNYETGALWTKHVRDWSDVQEESGRIPHIAPQINDFSFGGPMWSSAGLNVAWSFYQHHGDERILALTYPSSKRWLEVFEVKAVGRAVGRTGLPVEAFRTFVASAKQVAKTGGRGNGGVVTT
jgi:alpha-L-rhamnosidase